MIIIYFLELHGVTPVYGSTIRMHCTDTSDFADVLEQTECAWIVPGTIVLD